MKRYHVNVIPGKRWTLPLQIIQTYNQIRGSGEIEPLDVELKENESDHFEYL